MDTIRTQVERKIKSIFPVEQVTEARNRKWASLLSLSLFLPEWPTLKKNDFRTNNASTSCCQHLLPRCGRGHRVSAPLGLGGPRAGPRGLQPLGRRRVTGGLVRNLNSHSVHSSEKSWREPGSRGHSAQSLVRTGLQTARRGSCRFGSSTARRRPSWLRCSSERVPPGGLRVGHIRWHGWFCSFWAALPHRVRVGSLKSLSAVLPEQTGSFDPGNSCAIGVC